MTHARKILCCFGPPRNPQTWQTIDLDHTLEVPLKTNFTSSRIYHWPLKTICQKNCPLQNARQKGSNNAQKLKLLKMAYAKNWKYHIKPTRNWIVYYSEYWMTFPRKIFLCFSPPRNPQTGQKNDLDHTLEVPLKTNFISSRKHHWPLEVICQKNCTLQNAHQKGTDIARRLKKYLKWNTSSIECIT